MARNSTSTFYLDDSGVVAAARKLLVIGGIKIRRHGKLMREIRHIRDRAGFQREFKFNEINKGSLSAYYAMIDALERSDARLVACVATRPPNSGWRFYASVTTTVVRGNINRGELVGVLMDTISTPQNVALEDVVRGRVNRMLKATSVVTAACLDSRSSDGLQVADLVAGAVGFDRRRVAGVSGKVSSPKGRIVERLKQSVGVEDFADCRSGRVNIQTRQQPPK